MLGKLLFCKILLVFLIHLQPISGKKKHDDVMALCSLPVAEGKECAKEKPSDNYYFDQDSSICKKFKYKGCEGNENRFKEQDDCMDSCQMAHLNTKKGGGTTTSEEGEREASSDCHLPKDGGECKALIEQWYFDKNLGKCLTFHFGGCKGNNNRFNTEEECKQACMKELS